MLSEEQKQRALDLFAEVSELAPDEQAAILENLCRDDPDLLAEVRSLLACVMEEEPFLQAGGIPLREEDAADHTLQAGEHLGPYRIEGIAGEGGMGVVYRAAQREPIQRDVAIKCLRPGLVSPQTLARFDRERRTLLHLDHPNIARCFHEAFDDEGTPYFAMEYIDGRPLTTYCEEHGLGLETRLELLRTVCRAVHHAHQKGMLHRDLKPSNILVAEADGRPVPKIIDFGIAKELEDRTRALTILTLPGTLAGTLEYMSPEQADPFGDPVDTRSDVYALGVLLFELLTGTTPIHSGGGNATTHATMLDRVLHREPDRPSRCLRRRRACGEHTPPLHPSQVARELDSIARKALHRMRDERYGSAIEMADDLGRFLAGEPVTAAPGTRFYALRLFARRHPVPCALATFLLVLVTATALAMTAWSAEETRSVRLTATLREEERRASDPLRVTELIVRAEAPWPAETTLEANQVQIDAWISAAEDVLARTQQDVLVTADGVPAFRRQLIETLRAERPDLERLVTDLRERRVLLHATWPLWSRCQEELAGTPGFETLELTPHPYLVPLGVDLDRNVELGRQVERLWSFAVPSTGRIPRRVGPDGHDVALGEPGRAILEDDTAMVLVLVPGGRTLCGSQNTDPTGPNYEPRPDGAIEFASPLREVHLEPFLISKCEVTNAQYAHFLKHSGRDAPDYTRLGLEDRPGQPVTSVDWLEAQAFCEWLGLTLPSESQWEHAARAGTTTSYWVGQEPSRAARVCAPHGRNQPAHDVARGTQPPAPNPFGLHDVIGNVQEWAFDSWSRHQRDLPDDGSPRRHEYYKRAIRGGGHRDPVEMCGSAARRRLETSMRTWEVGFRPACNVAGDRSSWR
ncbi:MAG: SUMF1/EgtB/PvdO family nonheme iron enzyme [Planctomycetes bacterium]|nr:SUMF1/EgtB/PvdO family nonheme iron enzyme [Planctomycetota bacterium]